MSDFTFRLEASRKSLSNLLRQLQPAQLSCRLNKWTGKDALLSICVTDAEVTRNLLEWRSGEAQTPEILERSNHKDWVKRSVHRMQELTFPDLRNKLHETRTILLAALERVSDGPEESTLAAIVSFAVQAENETVAALSAWREGHDS